VAQGRSTSVGEDDALKVGKNLVIDAGDSVSIKTGSASITMKKDGTIQIKGKDITIDGSGQDQHQGRRRHRDEGIEDRAELRGGA
jgi:type VI secretion system secreted protein VgrG